MIENADHQRYLILPFFAHLVSGSFLDFAVILIGWKLIFDYRMKRIAASKCAFFISYR
jgi:hypothetical protein